MNTETLKSAVKLYIYKHAGRRAGITKDLVVAEELSRHVSISSVSRALYALGYKKEITTNTGHYIKHLFNPLTVKDIVASAHWRLNTHARIASAIVDLKKTYHLAPTRGTPCTRR